MASPIGGIDPAILDQIKQLMAGMGPSEEDKHAARSHALLTAGLGIMQNANLNPILAAGRGGLLGQQAYTDELRFEQQQRAQNMAGVAQMFPLLQKSAFMNLGQQYLNGGSGAGIPGLPQQGPTVTPQAGVAPSTAAQFGPMNGMPTGSMGMPPAPLSVPAGTAADQVAGYYSPADPRREAPPGVLGLAFGSGDPKIMVDTLTKFSQDVPGRNGMVFSPVGRPKYQITDAGIQYFNPDGTPGRFIANGAANTNAAAQRAGAVAGATTGAQEAAKQPYAFDVGIPGPNGRPISGYRNSIFGQPPVSSAPPQPQYTGATQAAVDAGQIPPRGVKMADWKAAIADAANNPGATLNYMDPSGAQTQSPMPGSPQAATGAVPVGGAPGTVLGPDPVEQAARTKYAESNITQAQKQLEDYQSKRPVAMQMISGLDNLERMDQKCVFNGPAQNKYMTAAIWLNSMFPGANLNVPQITDSQTYDSALKGIARSGLKSFGGRVTNAEFGSVLSSLPDRIATPDARAQMREMMGRAALDELNQTNSAEAAFNPSNGLRGWAPPSPIAAGQYWQSRARVMNLQPASGLNQTGRVMAAQVLKNGNPDNIRELTLSGVLQ